MPHTHSAHVQLLGATAGGVRAAPRPRSLHDHVLALQRTAGNRVVRRMLQRDTPAMKTPPAPSRARAYAPWDRVWIGHDGLLGEVVEKGVTVRMFRDWTAAVSRPTSRIFLTQSGIGFRSCGPHS